MDDVKKQLMKFKQENHDLEAELRSTSPWNGQVLIAIDTNISERSCGAEGPVT